MTFESGIQLTYTRPISSSVMRRVGFLPEVEKLAGNFGCAKFASEDPRRLHFVLPPDISVTSKTELNGNEKGALWSARDFLPL